MRLIRRSQLRAMPWKNGGGVTHEVAGFPEGAGFEDFAWRISMAEVASDGPFSAFPGIDRTLSLLEGAGLTLDFGGEAVRLAPGADPLSFPGEAPVTGRLVAGPILDLNVMTRRGRAVHGVATLPAGEPAPRHTIALVARTAPCNVGEHRLEPTDCLLADPQSDLAGLTGSGELLAIVVKMRP